MYTASSTAGSKTDLGSASQRHRLDTAPENTRLAGRSWLASPSSLLDLMCYETALLIVVLQKPFFNHQHVFSEALKLRISLENIIFGVICFVIWAICERLTSVEDYRDKTTFSIAIGLLLQVALSTTVLVPLLLLRRPVLARPSSAAGFFLISLAFILSTRLAIYCYDALVRPMMRPHRNVLIVGSGPRGRHVAGQLSSHPKWRYDLLGFVDPDKTESDEFVLGTLSDLESILVNKQIDEVIISLPIKSKYDQIQESIAICERVGVQSRYSTNLFETSITKRRTVDDHDASSIALHMVHDTGVALKRTLDIVLSAILLACLAPLFLVIAIATKLSSKGPVIYRQQRYGLNRRLFTMYKFRSMVTDAEKLQAHIEHMNETSGPVFKIKNDPRITKLGGFLRKTSLDELPQLWNVLLGDMSLVGPRPLPIRDVSRFSEASFMRRFSVRPGITGLWQVSGRSNTSFENWIRLDLDYIDRWSPLLDLRILLKTFSVVIRREGAV